LAQESHRRNAAAEGVPDVAITPKKKIKVIEEYHIEIDKMKKKNLP
jgi:hypothetical protein